MKKVHYAWIICAGSTLLIFCTIGLLSNAFSVFLPYIKAHGGLSNTQSSMIITLRNLSSLVSMLLVTRYYDALDIRKGAAVATVAAAVAFLTFGLADSFAMYGCAAIIAGGAYGLGGAIPVAIIINRWFSSHKAIAVSIASAGTGVASIIMPPIITAVIEGTSLRVGCFATSALAGMLSIITFALIRDYPQDKGLKPLGYTAPEGAEPVGAPQPQRQTPRSGHAMVCATLMIFGCIGNVGFSHLSILYRTEGFPSFTVSTLMTLAGITLTAGKFIYGYVTDRLKTYASNYIFFLVVIIMGLSQKAPKKKRANAQAQARFLM